MADYEQFIKESNGIGSPAPWAMDNSDVMERFGYRLCANCNVEMPADSFVGGWCAGCVETVGDPEWEEGWNAIATDD